MDMASKHICFIAIKQAVNKKHKYENVVDVVEK